MTDFIRKIPLFSRASDVKKPLTAGQIRKRDARRRTALRTVIQILFFLLAPSMFTSAFAGLKQIFTAVGQGQPLSLSSLVQILIMLCVFTMIFGRFFCGFACPFGSLGDLIYFLSGKVQKKLGKKHPALPEKAVRVLSCLPYGILAVILLLCCAGVYGSLTGWSPWDVFSMATALNFRLGRYTAGLILLGLILVGMAFESRFFCRFLCPMGAVFRLLPILPWAVLKRDTSKCLRGCSACTRNCPVGTELGLGRNAGDCIQCGKCAGICPKGNIGTGILRLAGNELWLTGCKALLLLGLALWLGAVRVFR